MYHEKKKWGYGFISCYDSIEEIPDICEVRFPEDDGRKPQPMTENEMEKLAWSEKDWYVIVPDHNYGVCDHWISIPFMRWICERYPRINRYVDDRQQTIGYNRQYRSVSLTKDKNFSKSEVWNS